MATKTVGVPYRILRDDTQAIMIDVQEKLTPHIHDHEAITDKMAILIQGYKRLACL